MTNPHVRRAGQRCLYGLIAIMSVACQGYSQSYLGQPLIAKTTTSSTTDAQHTIVDAFVYSTSGDICTRIRAAWNSVPANTSATIDARGFVDAGLLNCINSPFVNGRQGQLLLGNWHDSDKCTMANPCGSGGYWTRAYGSTRKQRHQHNHQSGCIAKLPRKRACDANDGSIWGED